MKKILGVSAIAASVLSASPATAAPYVNGTYAYSMTSMCEAKLTITKSAVGNVTSVNLNKGGLMSSGVGYIIFTPSSPGSTSGTARVTQSLQVEGGALRVDTFGNAWQQGSRDATGIPYQFRESGFTLGGENYRMVYGNRVGGVYQNFYLVRRDNSDPSNTNCVKSISASKR